MVVWQRDVQASPRSHACGGRGAAHGPVWQGFWATSSCMGRTGSRSGRGQGTRSRRMGTAASAGTLWGVGEGGGKYGVVAMVTVVVVSVCVCVCVLWGVGG